MSTRITQGPLIIPKENLDIHHKKATEDGKIKSSKTAAKKGGAGFGSRKALNDITNKSFLHQEASRKKELAKEEINVAEERFLHDHKKCIKAQQTAMDAFDLNLVLPGHESFSKSNNAVSPAKIDLTSLRSYPDPEELWMPENWQPKTSVKENSPPYSPTHWDSTTFLLKFEDVEFELRPENNSV